MMMQVERYDPEKIGRQLDNGVDIVVVDQVFADFLLRTADKARPELDDCRRAVGRQPRSMCIVRRVGLLGGIPAGENRGSFIKSGFHRPPT